MKHVLDTGYILSGKPLPPGVCMVSVESDQEIQPGGSSGRRYQRFLDEGLQIRMADSAQLERIRETAKQAGNLQRLSHADLSVLALALGEQATLHSNDFTVLDLAMRLGITTSNPEGKGIQRTMDFRPRCTGCGRWFDEDPKGNECPICGSPVKRKPAPRSSR